MSWVDLRGEVAELFEELRNDPSGVREWARGAAWADAGMHVDRYAARDRWTAANRDRVRQNQREWCRRRTPEQRAHRRKVENAYRARKRAEVRST